MPVIQAINQHKIWEKVSGAITPKAIEKAIQDLDSESVLVVAGKGHENYQEYKTKKNFSDRKFILKNIQLKNKKLSKDWKLNVLEEKFNKIRLNNIKFD